MVDGGSLSVKLQHAANHSYCCVPASALMGVQQLTHLHKLYGPLFAAQQLCSDGFKTHVGPDVHCQLVTFKACSFYIVTSRGTCKFAKWWRTTAFAPIKKTLNDNKQSKHGD